MSLPAFTSVCDFLNDRKLAARRARVLIALHEVPGISLADLSTLVGCSSANMTGMMDGLEGDGFVTRVYGTGPDRRIAKVKLTEKAREMIQTMSDLAPLKSSQNLNPEGTLWTVKCPDCKGRGTISGPNHRGESNAVFLCHVCGGMGTLTTDK